MRNCIIAQSGGPTVAINASLAGLLDANANQSYFGRCYGALNGITGILDDRLLDLSRIMSKTPDFTDRLIHTPAMYLGSCRYKLPDPDSEEGERIYERIFLLFQKYDIDSFFYIGGNDSMDTVLKLSRFAEKNRSSVKILGIPKTIDNDLAHTDHTPGFGSAAKYIATSLREIACDAYIYAVKSVTIVEIMGRDAGWLTAASVLARTDSSPAPQLIYLPEVPFDLAACVRDTKSLLERENNIIIAVSEGIRDAQGNYLSANQAVRDKFGHAQLSGTGKALETVMRDQLHVKTRSIELNVLQRAAAHCASATDLTESHDQGAYALTASMEGKSGQMMTIHRIEGAGYQTRIASSPIDQIANEVRSVPLAWINDAGNDVRQEMIDYLAPLISGQPSLFYKNGLPDYLDLSHLRG
ncbi:6-phosphofructokinase [Shuttleworthella satelles]|uniref:6-phosphofructokinase n=1 Tax=Shuttleworthella satelles TaxID=177972 RepID=UPI0028D47001|nr:6-phosphofructokinase [Shuttleworthia satelles]